MIEISTLLWYLINEVTSTLKPFKQFKGSIWLIETVGITLLLVLVFNGRLTDVDLTYPDLAFSRGSDAYFYC